MLQCCRVPAGSTDRGFVAIMALSSGSLLLQVVLLCALLAASVRRASGGRALTNYYYSYESTSFKVEWSSLSSCVDYVDYKKCSSYSFTKKVVILQCVMDEKCHKRAPETCCVDGDKEYKHHCYASCFGYKTYTPGKCHQKPPHEEHKKPKKPKHPKKPKQPKKPKKGHYEDMCDLCSGQQPKPGHGHGGKHGKW